MSDQPQCLCIPFEVFNLLPPPPFIQHIVLHSYLQQMEALMVSAFSGAMGSLLAKLGALLEKDFKLAKDAKKEIISLRDEMSSINAFLMKLSAMEEPVDVQLRELRSKVRELAYDMEDCVDIFMHNLGSNKKGLLHGLKMLRARYETATLIKTLKARAVGIGNWYELMTRLPGWPRTVWVDPRIQALYTDAAILQGIDDPKEKLVKLLKEDGACRLKVVSIVGFGGIGKTTLAKQVYTTIQGQYDCTAFVSMSRNPDLAKILSDIIKQFVGWFYSSLDDEKQLIEEFRDCLQDKRYFVVIDDIWTIEEWNIIKCCFVENNRGSRVITTTRIEDTAEACCSSFHGHVYRMKPLNDLDSRILFHRRIFHSEDSCPEHLKSVSNEILKKCGGLPLAILTIGSILASHQDSIEIWEKMINSFRFQQETCHSLEWIRHVFNIGYNDLPPNLKTCMLYLGIFPEDYKIRKDDLKRRWVAEGFVTEKLGYCQEEISESYINELINRNMIQIDEFDDCGEVLSCRVHDLMLDFIILKSTEENFITIINDQHSTKGPLEVRRLSLHVRNSSESNNVLQSMALTQARSFNLWGHAQWLPSSLRKFHFLRVLHLDIYGSKNMEYNMCSIRNLFQLRYLRTRGIGCNNLLPYLQKLEELKTLEVVTEGGYFVLDAGMLPSTLWHLIIPVGVVLAGRVGQMRSLRTLCKLPIDLKDAERMKELGELTNLRELVLFRSSYGVEDTCDVLLASLCKLCNLRSLIIRGSLEQDVLSHWLPPPHRLRRLHALECLFSTVPAGWITQLSNLHSLEIQVVSLLSDGIDILARLISLVHLKLHIQEHSPQDSTLVVRHAAFPNLWEFCFRCKTPCLMFEAGTMPRIRSLDIECYEQGARQANSVLDGIEHLGTLEEFKVHIYARESFIPMEFCCGDAMKSHEEKHRKWDRKSLEVAITEAISKHPRSFRVVIETV